MSLSSASSSDAFRKRVEYLEAVDDGWRNILADVDSVLKTFGSLTAQAATGELKSLLDFSKIQQTGRRSLLDNAFEDNLAELQRGASLEETVPVAVALDEIDWPQFVRKAWQSSVAPQTSASIAINGGSNSNSYTQLSQSLPNSAFSMMTHCENAISSLLQSKFGTNLSTMAATTTNNNKHFFNGNNNSNDIDSVNGAAKDVSSAAIAAKNEQHMHYMNGGSSFGGVGVGAVGQHARRHSVFALGDHRQQQQAIERMVPRHHREYGSTNLGLHSRLISSSIDSRCSNGFDEDSFTTNSEDISPTDNEDWDYESIMFNINNNNKVRPVGAENRLAATSSRRNLLAMRRGSSPPVVPPYAFDACQTLSAASITDSIMMKSNNGKNNNNAINNKDCATANNTSGYQYPRRVLLGYLGGSGGGDSNNHTNNGILPPSVVALLKDGKINPTSSSSSSEFALDIVNARYVVIKSFTEQSIFSSIKHSVWCSTFRGNQRLDKIYRTTTPAPVYLFFSVNNTGSFCGVAQMTTSVDFECYAGCWSTPRWKGAFGVRWLYVKDIPFRDFRDIILPDDGKPVCKSRDTQEVLPSCQGVKMLKIFHDRKVYSSVFDDFDYYEQQQQQQQQQQSSEDNKSRPSRHSFCVPDSSSFPSCGSSSAKNDEDMEQKQQQLAV